MTWLKLSDEFGDECARAELSDAAWRTHVEGLLWAMRRETGGRITDRDVRRFAETFDPASAVAELVAVGFWLVEGSGYRIRHHMEHQPDPEVIERRRQMDAERQRKRRRKQAGLTSEDTPDSGSHAVTPPVTTKRTPRVTRGGSGRDGETLPRREEQTHAREEQPSCGVCSEQLAPEHVAAGWTDHPSCGQEWPPIRQVSA